MGEKRMVKVSLGSLIYLFIIVILISIIAGIWLYYNSDSILKKNNQQTAVRQSTNTTIKIDDNTTLSDFELVYNALVAREKDIKNNNSNYIGSVINEITIFNDDVQNSKKIPEKFKNDNIIYRTL